MKGKVQLTEMPWAAVKFIDWTGGAMTIASIFAVNWAVWRGHDLLFSEPAHHRDVGVLFELAAAYAVIALLCLAAALLSLVIATLWHRWRVRA